MAVKTLVVRNSVDGSYDTFHVDPVTWVSDGAAHNVMTEAMQGTTHLKKDSHRDSDRTTAEGR